MFSQGTVCSCRPRDMPISHKEDFILFIFCQLAQPISQFWLTSKAYAIKQVSFILFSIYFSTSVEMEFPLLVIPRNYHESARPEHLSFPVAGVRISSVEKSTSVCYEIMVILQIGYRLHVIIWLSWVQTKFIVMTDFIGKGHLSLKSYMDIIVLVGYLCLWTIKCCRGF